MRFWRRKVVHYLATSRQGSISKAERHYPKRLHLFWVANSRVIVVHRLRERNIVRHDPRARRVRGLKTTCGWISE